MFCESILCIIYENMKCRQQRRMLLEPVLFLYHSNVFSFFMTSFIYSVHLFMNTALKICGVIVMAPAFLPPYAKASDLIENH